ncbi:MAG: DUF3108 domain-containing protein [Betaproteobacteria bacterium]|nr:DUF3108 domain-containing protein [Betaproteobacteria bacterium]
MGRLVAPRSVSVRLPFAWKRAAAVVLVAHLFILFGLETLLGLFSPQPPPAQLQMGPVSFQMLSERAPPIQSPTPQPFPGLSQIAQQNMLSPPVSVQAPPPADASPAGQPPASGVQKSSAERTPRPDELPGVGGVALSVFFGDHAGNTPIAKGSIEISFPSEGRYQIRLLTKALGWAAMFAPNPLFAETVGRIGPGGLQPERYTHRSPRGREEVSTFDYDTGKVIYSSLKEPLPLEKGIQDRLSFMIQLAWMLKIEPERFAVGESILLPMAGRNKVEKVNFTVISESDIVLPGGVIVPAIHLSTYGRGERVRGQIDVWLDRTDRLLPVRIRFEEARGQVLDLLAVRNP